MPKARLDLILVARGLAATRERARALILAGQVKVDGHPVTKAGTATHTDARIELRTPDHPWVGRGGLKLAHALDTFGLDVAGCLALDIGASTGGFTDVLLARGARAVVALDVGEGQLDWKLRTDPRVVCLERVNARYLTRETLPEGMQQVDVITVDVSFISLRHILPTLPPLLSHEGRVVALVKPQFEAGRHEVASGGIVRDPAVQERAVETVTAAAADAGLVRLAIEPSPITGAEGNREFLLLLAAPATGRGAGSSAPATR